MLMPGVQGLVGNFTEFIIRPAVNVLFALGFLLFVWGLIEFLHAINQGRDSSEGKQHMLWGLIGMLIMVSALSIIRLLTGSFGIKV